MDRTLEAKLARIANRQTRYELVATHPNGRRLLVGYTHKSKMGIFSMLQKNGPAVVKAFDMDDSAIMTFAKSGRTATVGEWTVAFSGRTQREAYLDVAGELPFIAA